ncbi:MAG: hypothetical protein OXB93_03190, partial [Cytophagales bacterium]|nr:hypothetical protein [Cytophagales bacterium]
MAKIMEVRATLVFFIFVGLLIGPHFTSLGQERGEGYNPFSLYPVHKSKIMFSKILWWRVDLNE